MPSPALRVLSLGAGVQSTALLLMYDRGVIQERLDAAVFSDTGWEPKAVYEHLARLEDAVSIPIVKVSAGNIREDFLNGVGPDGKARDFLTMPSFARNLDTRKPVMLRRQCTREYKIEPIRRAVRAMVEDRGLKLCDGLVEQIIGISADEPQRAKMADVRYISHRWPLLEMGLTRKHLIPWLTAQGFGDTPKSACIGCPFHDDGAWQRLKEDQPEEWREAVEFDAAIRVQRGLEGEAYLHRSCQPLDTVTFRPRRTDEQGDLDFFGLECEGMCGV